MQTPPFIKVGCINRGWKTITLKEFGEEQASTITTLVWVKAIFCSLVSCLPIAYPCVWIKNFFRTMNLLHGVLTLPFFARFKTEPIDVLDRWLLVVSAGYEYIAPRKLPKNRLVTQVLNQSVCQPFIGYISFITIFQDQTPTFLWVQDPEVPVVYPENWCFELPYIHLD